MVLLEFLFHVIGEIVDKPLNELSISFDFRVTKPINNGEKGR